MDQYPGQNKGYEQNNTRDGGVTHACPTCGLKVDFTVTICPRDGSLIADYSSTERLLDDRYQILSLVASGGMGSIYKARQPLLNRIVAIKMLRVQSHNDAAWVRFQQEAKAASHLEHRNIIRVQDFGQTSDGQPYMVMDFVEGSNLQSIIKDEGFLPIEESLNIFKQICSGMTHAHAHHVYHRDLKPSNIMLSNLDSINPLVRIVDFGIAKVLDSQSEGQNLTQTGEVFGTPFYMSPEQALGKKVDARSDIYSVGCIMHATLTGSVPLAGATSFETLMKHMNDKPLSIKQARPEGTFSDELVALVSKALAKDPGKRHQTMLELSEALEELPEAIAIAKKRGPAHGVSGLTTSSIKIRNFPKQQSAPPSKSSGVTKWIDKYKPILLALIFLIIVGTGLVYIKFGTKFIHVTDVNARIEKIDNDLLEKAATEKRAPNGDASKLVEQNTPAATDETDKDESAITISLATTSNTAVSKSKSESEQEDSWPSVKKSTKIPEEAGSEDSEKKIIPNIIANPKPVSSAPIELVHSPTDMQLAEAVKQNPGSQAVVVKGKALSDDGILILSKLKLRSLVIQDTLISSKGFAILKDFPNLEVLNLRNNERLEDTSLAAIANMKNLKVLELTNCNRITDESMQHLPKNITMMSIQGDFHITEKGVQAISELSNLETFDCSSMPFTDEDLRLISRLQKLRILYISGTCITDKGVVSMLKMPMKEITISDTKITEKGFMQLSEMPHIMRVTVTQCPYINNEMREKLRHKGKLIFVEPFNF